MYTEQFDNLEENLDILQEEAAEIIQIVSKIKRFGLYSTYPQDETTNLSHLHQEIADFQAMVDVLTDHGYIDLAELSRRKERKLDKLAHYYGAEKAN